MGLIWAKYKQWANRAKEFESRIAFLEEKQNPRVIAILKEATELGMDPKHIAYNRYRYANPNNYWGGWATFEEFEKDVDKKKAEKYDQCKQAGKCEPDPIPAIGGDRYGYEIVYRKKKKSRKRK